MRVAYVSSHADFVGGGEYSLFELMTHLPETIDPVLLLPGEGGLSRRADEAGIAWCVAPMPPIGWRTPLALGRWRTLLRELRPHILHANNSRAAFYAGFAGKRSNTPMLFHCRVNLPDPALDALVVRLSSGVIANSQATAGRFSGWKNKPLWVVHNGLELSAFEGGRTEAKPFGAGRLMLMVARVSRLKRHDIALEVFARLADRFPDLHLALVGGVDDSEWKAELEQRSSRLGAANRIHWPGEANREDLARWYAAADVLVLPSDYESFGRVLVEAMAAGVPPVAFAVGGVSEVVEHEQQGLLVPAGDVEAMAGAVARLLEDDGLRVWMGEAGRKRARLFSIERHVERICGIYREVLP